MPHMQQLVCWTPIKPEVEAMWHQAYSVPREPRLHLTFLELPSSSKLGQRHKW